MIGWALLAEISLNGLFGVLAPYIGILVTIVTGFLVFKYGKLAGTKMILETANTEITILKGQNTRQQEEIAKLKEDIATLQTHLNVLTSYVRFDTVPPAFQAALDRAADTNRHVYEIGSQSIASAVREESHTTQELLRTLIEQFKLSVVHEVK